jgi:hypothetical protein
VTTFAGTPATARNSWERLDSYLSVLGSEDAEILRSDIASLLADVKPADGRMADMEALLLEAGRRDLEVLLQIVRPIAADLPLAERIEQFADQRTRVHEQMSPGWRAARIQQPFSPELRRSKRRMTALGRAELEAVFAAELAVLAGQQRKALADALHGISIWAFWDSLRTDVGLGPQQAREAVVGIITAQLTQAGFSI